MAHSLATAGATYAGAALTGRRAPAGRVAVRGSSLKVRAADATAEFDPRTFRRELSKSGKYNRKFLKDCLLYTSPSPRDATLSRMPSSA